MVVHYTHCLEMPACFGAIKTWVVVNEQPLILVHLDLSSSDLLASPMACRKVCFAAPPPKKKGMHASPFSASNYPKGTVTHSS